MGFGLGIPGFRISTRGVRIGPRIANVKVGRGGPRLTVGPKLGRISVGKHGATISTGLGPLRISNRGAGIRVGGVTVSNRGIGAVVSPGLIWFGGNLKVPRMGGGRTHRRFGYVAGNLGLTKSSNTFFHISPSLSASFADYQRQLSVSGVVRRNRYEIRTAAAQSLFWEMSTMVAFGRTFEKVVLPQVPAMPSNLEIFEKSREQIKSKFQYPKWKKNGTLSRWVLRAHAAKVAKSKNSFRFFILNFSPLIKTECENLKRTISSDIDLLVRGYSDLKKSLNTQRVDFETAVRLTHDKFVRLDKEVLGVVMQSLLSDNPVPATWVGCQNDCGLVLVAFGDSTSVVWSEVHSFDQHGRAKVKKRSKSDVKALHQAVLLRTLIAAAKEVMEAGSNLKKVRVIAVENLMKQPTLDRKVWGEITITQNETKNLRISQRCLDDWNRLATHWETSGGEVDDEHEVQFFSQLDQISTQLQMVDAQMFQHFAGRLKGHVSKKTKEMVPMGSLRDVLDNDGLKWLAESENFDFIEEIRSIANTDVGSSEFWVEIYKRFVV